MQKAMLEEHRRAVPQRRRGHGPIDSKQSNRPGGSLGIAKRASALRRAVDERPARWSLAGGGVPAAGGGKASQKLVGPFRGLATERQTIVPRQGSAMRPSALSKVWPIDRAGVPWQGIAKDLPRDFAEAIYDETPRPCRRLYMDQLLHPSWCSSLADPLARLQG